MKFIEHVVLEAPVEVLGLGTLLADLLQLFLDVTPAMAGVGTGPGADGKDASLSKGETSATTMREREHFKLQKKTQGHYQTQGRTPSPQQQRTSRTVHDSTNSDSADEGEDGDSPYSRLNRPGRSSVEWRQYRMSGHLRLAEALLQRAGEHGPCMDAVAMLLRRMTMEEDLPLSGTWRW